MQAFFGKQPITAQVSWCTLPVYVGRGSRNLRTCGHDQMTRQHLRRLQHTFGGPLHIYGK
jgi:hypothetical protein